MIGDLRDLRRRLHQIPEIGLEVSQTQQLLLAELAPLAGHGVTIVPGKGLPSIAVVVEGDLPGSTVLLRAEMDGLAIAEESGETFASRNGAMHACGHDLHMAGLVGAVRRLAAGRADMGGNVVAMFQPGEEGPGGAPLMIGEGVLDLTGSRPVAAYAQHVFPGEAGVVSIRPGTMMAGADSFELTVTGRGGHASRPHAAVDPVAALAACLEAAHVHVTRTVDIADPAVLTFTTLSAGAAVNVIPDAATAGGTLRTLSETRLAALRVSLPRLFASIAEAHGCAADLAFRPGYPPMVNAAEPTRIIEETVRALFGGPRLRALPAPEMTAEDFAFVAREVPAALAFVGATPADVVDRDVEFNHSPRARFDDTVVVDIAELFVALAGRHLGPRAGTHDRPEEDTTKEET